MLVHCELVVHTFGCFESRYAGILTVFSFTIRAILLRTHSYMLWAGFKPACLAWDKVSTLETYLECRPRLPPRWAPSGRNHTRWWSDGTEIENTIFIRPDYDKNRWWWYQSITRCCTRAIVVFFKLLSVMPISSRLMIVHALLYAHDCYPQRHRWLASATFPMRVHDLIWLSLWRCPDAVHQYPK